MSTSTTVKENSVRRNLITTSCLAVSMVTIEERLAGTEKNNHLNEPTWLKVFWNLQFFPGPDLTFFFVIEV